MKFFIAVCLSMCLLAEAVPLESDSDTDLEDLAGEILDVFLNKKSTMGGDDAAADEETDDDLDIRILEDILASDQDGLVNDLEARMNIKKEFREFVTTTLVPGVTKYLREATQKLPGVVEGILSNSRKEFSCQLAEVNSPKYLKTLKEVFPKIRGIANGICESK